MKQTILSHDRLNRTWNRAKRAAAIACGAVVVLFVFGLQGADAQTMYDLGEQRADAILTELNAEIDRLGLELKYPTQGIKTDFNQRLESYYAGVRNDFKAGADIKAELLDISRMIVSATYGDALDVNPALAGSTMEVNREDQAGFESVVDAWNAEQDSLESVFEYWRTVKNR